jgi:hypothetical protein
MYAEDCIYERADTLILDWDDDLAEVPVIGSSKFGLIVGSDLVRVQQLLQFTPATWFSGL